MGKILMHGRSIATIENSLMRDFDINCKVVNFAAWIRERAYEDFKIKLSTSDDIDKLDEAVLKLYYRDKAEWLRDKMRTAVLEVKNKKK